MSDTPKITPSIITETTDDAPTTPGRVSGLAIAGFVLVLLCPVALAVLPGTRVTPLLSFGLALLGLVVCVVAWGVIGRSGGRLTGVPLAAAGILLALVFFAVLSLLGRLDSTSKRNFCLRNQQQISLAMSQYAQDYGRFPADWAAIRAYVDTHVNADFAWSCPAHRPLDPRPTVNPYGINAAVLGQKPAAFSDPAMLLFTADAARDVITTDADLARTRHGGTFIASFADGHVVMLGSREAVRLAP